MAIDTDTLAEILTELDARFANGGTAASAIAYLVEHRDAVLKTDGAVNTLRCAGVTGSCSWSQDQGLLGSWRRNAEKRAGPSANGGIGHNSRVAATDDRLRLLVERIERLEEEKKGMADDIRDVYGEAKAVGYDTKQIRQLIKLRKMNPDDRREQETILEVYKSALGMA